MKWSNYGFRKQSVHIEKIIYFILSCNEQSQWYEKMIWKNQLKNLINDRNDARSAGNFMNIIQRRGSACQRYWSDFKYGI